MEPGEKTFDMDGDPWLPVAPVKPVSPEAPVAPVIPELPVTPVKPAKAEAVSQSVNLHQFQPPRLI